MRKYATAICLLALLLAAACNQDEAESPATATAQAVPGTTVAAEPPAQPKQESADVHQSSAGSILALNTGEEVTVLSVGDFDQRLKDLTGVVAIEGRVKAAYPERGALVLVDCANMAGCGDGCCPQAEVPVRLALEDYSGAMPEADREVVVIADITVLEAGYELAVREIRQGEEVLLSLKT